ncbi:MAG TPA: hypothetical protein VK689_10430 [Armatimonadota bacterium]|nr:hypothetical protein [Armatimonadota bacterium]
MTGRPPRVTESRFSVLPENEAKELISQKSSSSSEDPDELLMLAAAYQARRVYHEALRIYERLARVAPEEPAFQAALADYYERAGRVPEAMAALQRAHDLKRQADRAD